MTELIPTRNKACQTKHVVNLPSLNFRSAIIEWRHEIPRFETQLTVTSMKINS